MKIVSHLSVSKPEYELQCSVVENTYNSSELSGKYYGLRLDKLINSVPCEYEEILDVSPDKDFVSFIQQSLLNGFVEMVHFRDIVEDFINERYSA